MFSIKGCLVNRIVRSKEAKQMIGNLALGMLLPGS